MRNLTNKTTQQKKSEPVKWRKVYLNQLSKSRKVGSKRKEKVSKERKAELVQNAKTRVISNQQELQELKKANK